MRVHVMRTLAVFAAILAPAACSPAGDAGATADAEVSEPASGGGQEAAVDVEALRAALGADGTEQEGQWKVTVPQNDLDVEVEGFRIVPPMGLGSWATFTPAPEGAAVMGDLVLREEEVGPVQRTLLERGLTVTALHKHFLRESPRVSYMHFGGRGPEAELGASVRAVLDRIAGLRGGDPGAARADEVPNTLDTRRLEEILGHAGSSSRGVFKVTIGRPDVALRIDGVEVTAFGGFSTWASFQGAPGRAAVAGDFAMLAGEVDGVIRALAEHGIEAVALHNHMVQEEPRIFFVHFWGVGPAEDLARGLRAALDRTATPAADRSPDASPDAGSR